LGFAARLKSCPLKKRLEKGQEEEPRFQVLRPVDHAGPKNRAYGGDEAESGETNFGLDKAVTSVIGFGL